jgi:copper(I)-binding protein
MTGALRAAAMVAVLAAGGSASAADPPSAQAAWARATPPGLEVGAAYVTLTGGTADDTLTAARIDGVARIEFHETTTEAGIARMRRSSAVRVPAQTRVQLAPNGLHLMLIDLARPLVAGERRTLLLVFERAGEVPVSLEVRAANAATTSGP